MKAYWNDELIAESDKTVVVEGNHYFPEESLDKSLIKESQTTSTCHWKGTANYYSLNVNGQLNQDAVWFYKTPKEAAKQIKGHVAFWKGVVVSE